MNLFDRLRFGITEVWRGNDLKCYNGTYAGGKAKYHYYEDNGRRIYHGRMSYSLAYQDLTYGVGQKKAEGAFADGRKHGRWRFASRKRNDMSELRISYVDGVAEGEYVFKCDRRDQLELHRGRSVLRMSMRNGKPVGSLEARLSNCILTGSCDDEGQPDGLWTLDFTVKGSCTVNYERWQHGVCVDAYEFDNSTGKRKKPKVKITEFLSGFIYNNLSPLTKIMPKGSAEWSGRFSA